MVRKLFIFFLTGYSLFALDIKETIETTLSNNPDIMIYKENVNYFRGLQQSAEGMFDTMLSSTISRENDDVPNSTYYESGMNKAQIVSYGVKLDKKFESGFDVQGGIKYQGEDVSINGYDSSSGLSDVKVKSNYTKVYFNIIKPLLKGAGSDVVTADKELAKINTQIGLLNYRRQINSSVYKSVLSYWNYLYAVEAYKIEKDAKERSQKLLEITKKLIKADVLPASGILHPTVDLNSKSSALIIAKDDMKNAKYDLCVQIGDKLEKMESLGDPDTQFPLPDEMILKRIDDRASFYEIAFENRADYQVSKKNLEKSKVTLDVATDDLKSQLDLKLYADHKNIQNDGDMYTSLTNPYDHHINGQTVGASLVYTIPIANNYAQGRYIALKSKIAQEYVRDAELKRDIELQINKTLDNLQSIILNYEEIKNSVESYEKLLANEMKKYLLGMSTIADVIQIQDSYDAQKMQLLEVLKSYAILLAQLNYNTGICVEDGTGHYTVEHRKFLEGKQWM